MVKAKKCGRMSVPVCRDEKGQFKSHGRGAATSKKRKTIKKGAVCKPGTTKRYGKVRCGCKTRGGGFKAVPMSKCRRKR